MERFYRTRKKKDYYLKLSEKIEKASQDAKVYPIKEEIFSAFNLTPYDNVKVVIIGQDPYHGEGQAHGLSFSVKPGVKVPPSLKNIYKELESDLGIKSANHGYLEAWAKQGVLMINTS